MSDAAGSPDLPLVVWLSPAFPVGGFAYSHGLEAAVDAGVVAGMPDLVGWLADLLEHGSIRQDALLLAAAWRAARGRDPAGLADTNQLALALCTSRERRLETATMGTSFLSVLRATWPAAVPNGMVEGEVVYPVAVGAASGALALDLVRTLELYALAFIANLVSAALRLGVIGQTDGQRVTLGALQGVRSLATAAAAASLDDLGACAFRSDLAALHHETQYSRLFRS